MCFGYGIHSPMYMLVGDKHTDCQYNLTKRPKRSEANPQVGQ